MDSFWPREITADKEIYLGVGLKEWEVFLNKNVV